MPFQPAPLVLTTMTERAAARSPDHVALVSGDEYMHYATLHHAVLRCVAALRASGIGKGDRVGYLGLNSIDYVILMQAAMRIGAVRSRSTGDWSRARSPISWVTPTSR